MKSFLCTYAVRVRLAYPCMHLVIFVSILLAAAKTLPHFPSVVSPTMAVGTAPKRRHLGPVTRISAASFPAVDR